MILLILSRIRYHFKHADKLSNPLKVTIFKADCNKKDDIDYTVIMSKRIFIGLTVSEQIKKDVKNLSNEFSYLNITWVPIENLHITLLPPWKSADFQNDLNTFKNIKLPSPQTPLNFDKIIFEKRTRHLRAIGSATSEITNLIDNVTEKMNRVKDNRDFTMHITLAKKVSLDLQFPEIKLNWEFVPKAITMFESIQHKHDTDYKIIHELPFTDIENEGIL